MTIVFPPMPRATAFADAAMNFQPLGVYALAILETITQKLEELNAC